MATKLFSFDVMENVLGAEDKHLACAGGDNRDSEYRQILQTLTAIIDKELTPRQQECVRLYYADGLKMREVAVALGIQTPAVSRHLKKARRRVERILRYHFDRLS